MPYRFVSANGGCRTQATAAARRPDRGTRSGACRWIIRSSIAKQTRCWPTATFTPHTATEHQQHDQIHAAVTHSWTLRDDTLGRADLAHDHGDLIPTVNRCAQPAPQILEPLNPARATRGPGFIQPSQAPSVLTTDAASQRGSKNMKDAGAVTTVGVGTNQSPSVSYVFGRLCCQGVRTIRSPGLVFSLGWAVLLLVGGFLLLWRAGERVGRG
jgi:hypothetical protein